MMVIVCGGLRIDFLISADGQVRLNQPGGNALYAAVGARMVTDQVMILARAGENYPQAWLDDLARHGILSDYVRRVPGSQDMRTFYAYVDAKTRVDRDPEIHFARIGQPLPPELEGYRFSTQDTQNEGSALALRGEDVPPGLRAISAHLAPTALRSQHELVYEFRQRGVPQITVDPGEYRMTGENERKLKEMCAQIDAFLPSELEVDLLLNTDDVYAAAETFASWGTPVVVIKRGPDGCLLYERDSRRFTTIPPYPADVVDVTGAGDVFSGAFAAALGQTGKRQFSELLSKRQFPELLSKPRLAALMGTVAASFAIEGYGALYALNPPREQVLKAVPGTAVQERLEKLKALSGLD